ncbi:MAG TPA: MBL fold metallo-hydrolase, partial [Povalibacter sp.]|nr:MBL fold metallo-hydrolase [Povalibacter sp.]
AAVASVGLASAAHAKNLEIYFIDVEGGQSTLVVTPRGETLLIDTGYAGNEARDAKRIAAAAHDAGVRRIDYLLITHFHSDHDGGAPELAQLLPIRTFVDHGNVPAVAEETVPGTLAAFDAYAAVRKTGHHIEPKPGDRLPLRGVDVRVVSSAGATLTQVLADGADNAACGSVRPPGDPNENPRSTGIVLTFDQFRFLDVGDLTGQPLFNLACPRNMIGAVDVYLVAHHGGADAADPATFAAFKPRVALLNNGAKKGGAPEMFQSLHQLSGTDVWQLHRSNAAGDSNFDAARIANIDESTEHWIRVSASSDGSFRVLNGRTGEWLSYPAR